MLICSDEHKENIDKSGQWALSLRGFVGWLRLDRSRAKQMRAAGMKSLITEGRRGCDPSPSGDPCAYVCLWIWNRRCARQTPGAATVPS